MTTGDGEILPEDLIFEILLLLPVTSLIRFKCVSKRWKEIISNPEFSYLQYSKISRNRYLVDIMATVWQEPLQTHPGYQNNMQSDGTTTSVSATPHPPPQLL
uniref:F-box domain-containing protein n=1 Tax=Kalanchoe fedtschenkoi TaxID=63787 RepID=A0A7N0VC38_KALFE